MRTDTWGLPAWHCAVAILPLRSSPHSLVCSWLYFCPMAHFVLGVAMAGLREDQRGAEAFRVALLQNPHFPQAHPWLARLLKFRLKTASPSKSILATIGLCGGAKR